MTSPSSRVWADARDAPDGGVSRLYTLPQIYRCGGESFSEHATQTYLGFFSLLNLFLSAYILRFSWTFISLEPWNVKSGEVLFTATSRSLPKGFVDAILLRCGSAEVV